MRPASGPVLLGASVTAVVAAVAAGLVVLGSPGDERARRLDARRVADLRSIATAADLYWTRHGRLPASLDELTAEPGVSLRARDPSSGEVYGYAPLDDTRYEVCATFERESEEISRSPTWNLWAHGSGRQCFAFEAEEITRNEGRWLRAPGARRPPPDPAARPR